MAAGKGKGRAASLTALFDGCIGERYRRAPRGWSLEIAAHRQGEDRADQLVVLLAEQQRRSRPAPVIDVSGRAVARVEQVDHRQPYGQPGQILALDKAADEPRPLPVRAAPGSDNRSVEMVIDASAPQAKRLRGTSWRNEKSIQASWLPPIDRSMPVSGSRTRVRSIPKSRRAWRRASRSGRTGSCWC